MQTLTKTIVGGGLVGLALSGLLAVPSILPPTLAQEEPAATLLKASEQIFGKPIDGADFVKPDPHITESWVSTVPISRQTVRKIGYGRTTFVDIATTETGTYSSDGLASPHVLYPGIHENPDYAEWRARPRIAVLDGGSWVVLRLAGAHSFVDVIPFKGGELGIREDGSACARVGRAIYC